VTKQYGGLNRPALDDINVEVEKGEFVFLVGASGSGKSTFLRRNIGCVFQDYKLLNNKTVYENVAFALEVIGRPRHVVKTQVPAILELVGLAKKMDNMPDELSGGEQQRVSIARAFVNRPLILLADEPTGNLDPATSVGIMRLLDRINRTGTTVLMATHDRAIVDTMRRRVIELDRGTIIRDQARGVYE
jgi:cell division transport system ATP-binding protein